MEKLELSNYLEGMIESKGKAICVRGCEKNIKYIILKLKTRSSIISISKKLGVSLRLVYYWINGEKPIPISKINNCLNYLKKILNYQKESLTSYGMKFIIQLILSQ